MHQIITSASQLHVGDVLTLDIVASCGSIVREGLVLGVDEKNNRFSAFTNEGEVFRKLHPFNIMFIKQLAQMSAIEGLEVDLGDLNDFDSDCPMGDNGE
jgi:hypothetical protein